MALITTTDNSSCFYWSVWELTSFNQNFVMSGSRKFCQRGGGQALQRFFFFFFFVDEGLADRNSKYHYKRATIGLPANAILMAFRWRADDGTTLKAGPVAS